MNKIITQRIFNKILDKKDIIKLSNLKLNKKKIMEGEITEPLTISNNNGIPIYNGIYCEKIFGPILNFKCRCYRVNNIYCDFCNIIKSSNIIRRYKLGYVKLNSYFLNILYLNYLQNFLNIKKNFIFKLFNYNFILNKKINYLHTYYKISLIIYKILENINLYNEVNKINKLNFKYKNDFKKLDLLKLFFINKINPKNLLLNYLPILPPSVRPIFYFNNNKFFLTYLNKIYIKLISHNNKLNYWLKNEKINNIYIIYSIIEKRYIQIYLNYLFNVNKCNKKKNLINNFSGKYNKFREQILGKRVDMSGRSVIISSTSNNILNIGIPLNMMLLFFKKLIKIIIKKFYNINKIIYNNNFYIKFLINYIRFNKFILINRAPTLHKLNIQSFYINTVENNSIKLNPISCSAFNADFDGDQMSVFIPISIKSQLESKFKINTIKNIYKDLSGDKIKKLTQSSIIGLNVINNLTLNSKVKKNLLNYFSDINDLIYYLNYNSINLNIMNIFRHVNYKYSYTLNFYLVNTKKYIYLK